MWLVNKTITVPFDFTQKFIKNFVDNIANLTSNPYFITTDRSVNAKSILGVMSANISKGDIIVINVYGNSQEQVGKDLFAIYNLICGAENDM